MKDKIRNKYRFNFGTINFRNVLILFFVLICSKTMSQQLPQFTQYMFNTISINPAYAGSRGKPNLTVLHRDQWSGLEGNPRTSTFSFHSPLKNDKIGLGVSYISDRLGFEKTNYIYADFSYSVLLSRSVKLSLGIKAGFSEYQLTTPDLNDPFFNSDSNSWRPNFGAGAYISSDRWYVGVSTPRILNVGIQNDALIAEKISYYTIGGLVLDLSANVKFKPTTIIKFTNGAPITYDITSSFLMYEKVWLGASYRFNDASNFAAFIDFQVNNSVRVGYAYDVPTSTIKPYSNGTHEIILVFEPSFKKRNNLYRSPRYF